jgi:membrane protein involved in colicin uptake
MATPTPGASGTESTPATAPAGAAPQTPPAEPDWKVEAEKWKALSRQNEATAKANKSAADELQQLKDAQLSDQQKAEKAAQKAIAEAADAQAQLARYRVAAEKKVPVELLTASDEASLKAQADALLAFVGNQSPSPDLGQGNRGPAAAPQDPNAWLRRMAGRE